MTIKGKYAVAIMGIILNIANAAFAVHFLMKFHSGWDKIAPNVKLAYDDKLLHILCYEVLPVQIAAMGFSAMLFWLLRK